MKISSIPKSGRKGSVVYVNSRHGKVARGYVRPRDPRTPDQQRKRSNLVAVCSRWRTLTPEQHAAWRIAAANNSFVTETGRRVRLNGYNFFVSLNMRRTAPRPSPFAGFPRLGGPSAPSLAPWEAEPLVPQPSPFWRSIPAYRPISSPEPRRSTSYRG
jgi:hypothetical protein